MYRLVFLTGARKGRRLSVQQGNLLIGRDHDVNLDLRDDDEVSHHHAIIEEEADGYYLKDLGGLNPAEVNGQAVRGVIKLKHDDQIEIGRTVMQFQSVEIAPASARRSAGPLQVVTFSLLGVILLAQLAYWVVFPRIHQAPIAEGEPARSTAPAPAPPGKPAADPLQAELEQALAQAEEEQQAPDLPPPDTPPPPAAAVTNEVLELRTALADLHKQVEHLAAATNPPPAPDAAGEPAPQAPLEATPEAVLLAKAKALLASALAQEQHENLLESDALLERLQALAPDFVPAYVERARLYEKRGMLKKAGEQWTQALNRSTGTPLYDQAAAERQRLARAEIMLTMAKPVPQPGDAENARLPRAIRIVSIEREKFEASHDYDEMRVARVLLRPRPSEGAINVDEVAVTVTFYDRDEATGKTRPSRAVTPTEPLRVDGLWRSGEQKSVTAAYIVPRDFRKSESAEHGGHSRYEGVRVRVYYRDRLQDEESTPTSLLKLPAPPAPAAATSPQAATPSAP